MAVIDHIPYSPSRLLLVWAYTGQHTDKREQRVACRALAPKLLQSLLRYADLPPSLINTIRRTATGRPYFPNVTEVDFNISHSGSWVAVALTYGETQSAVGLDIELPKARAFADLITHIGDVYEYEWWVQSADRCCAFYQAWCLREAVLKSQGQGIAKLHSVQHNPTQETIITPYAPAGSVRFYTDLPFYLALFNQGDELPVSTFEWYSGELRAREMKSAVCYQVKPHFHSTR